FGTYYVDHTNKKAQYRHPCAPRYDHILKWELFQLADLDTYQGMLKLLFMKELEQIVKMYEAYRQALLTELENRKQRQQWYAQQHGKNF
ncbi:SAV1 isoform 4, partial [Pan troglodytes]